jgi:hypothetical protein
MGARLLAAAAKQVEVNYRAWADRRAALSGALMPVVEMGIEFTDFADQLAKELPPKAAAHFREHARHRVERATDAIFELSDDREGSGLFDAQVDPGAYFPRPTERLIEEHERILERAALRVQRPFVPPGEETQQPPPKRPRAK